MGRMSHFTGAAPWPLLIHNSGGNTSGEVRNSRRPYAGRAALLSGVCGTRLQTGRQTGRQRHIAGGRPEDAQAAAKRCTDEAWPHWAGIDGTCEAAKAKAACVAAAL